MHVFSKTRLAIAVLAASATLVPLIAAAKDVTETQTTLIGKRDVAHTARAQDKADAALPALPVTVEAAKPAAPAKTQS
jgi:hypothetical protein